MSPFKSTIQRGDILPIDKPPMIPDRWCIFMYCMQLKTKIISK